MSTTIHTIRLPRSSTPPLKKIKRYAGAVCRRLKVKVKHVADIPKRIRAGPRKPHWAPPEVLEMIMAYLVYDVPTLKACAMTCFAWYNVATPHMFRTLAFRQWTQDPSRTYFQPLEHLHQFGVLPFVRQIRFERQASVKPWVGPPMFDSRNMRYLCALENLQDLAVADLDFFRFPMGLGEYFGHFSPRLRSVALSGPRGSRRQMLSFLMLFPKLEDIKISHYHTWVGRPDGIDTPIIPFKGELRGQMVLRNFGDEELLRDIAYAFGGMRFTFVNLHDTLGMQFVLDACGDSIEIAHMNPCGPFQRLFHQRFNLSSNTALRSLEVLGTLIADPPKNAPVVSDLLSTIRSPAFSELIVVFSEFEIRWPLKGLDEVLREMYKVKKFRVSFCVETLEELRVWNLRRLTSDTRKAVARGAYDFLPSPPFVYSRTVTRYGRLSLDPRVM